MPLAGLTELCPLPTDGAPRRPALDCNATASNTTRFSAFRVHAGLEPLEYEGSTGLLVTWRNGEPGHGGSAPSAVNATAFSLVYEWDSGERAAAQAT